MGKTIKIMVIEWDKNYILYITTDITMVYGEYIQLYIYIVQLYKFMQ